MSQKTKAMKKSVEVVESDEPMMLLVHENRYDFSKDSGNWNQPMIAIPQIAATKVKMKALPGTKVPKDMMWTQNPKIWDAFLAVEHEMDKNEFRAKEEARMRVAAKELGKKEKELRKLQKVVERIAKKSAMDEKKMQAMKLIAKQREARL